MSDEHHVIHLGDAVIDLAEEREPTLVEVACSPAVRRAAARNAMRELESHHRIAEEDARIARSEGLVVIAVIDLDDLKVVNDERGHMHGDLLLRLTARTLRHAVRTCDVVARVGGDEFAVLAVDFEGDSSVLKERITRGLNAAEIEASVGVASPTPGMSLVEAYDRADRAMYAQKRNRQRRAPADS